MPAALYENDKGFDAMIEACQIFKKYENPHGLFNCDHDEMSICIDPDIVSEEDKKRLDELSFVAGDGRFYSFRFGSC